MTILASPAAHRLVGSAALLLTTSLANAQIDVALCAAAGSAAACQWTDVQTRLQATGLFNSVAILDVTAAGGGTPALATLLQYDALLCWTNTTPANNVTWGDVLADYVDAGGGVVVAVFANSTTTAGRNIDGRWQTGYEVILDGGGNGFGSNHTLGTVHAPAHPLMGSVSAFQGGTTGSRPNGTALEVGSTLIAEWSNGKVLVAVGASPRRVDLGFYPPHSTCSPSGWTDGGDLLMANALLYAAGAGMYGSYGVGCAGSAGVPTLAAATGQRPVLGTSFTVDLGNLPNGAGIVVTGFSAAMHGPFTLPLDLQPFGLGVGCSLRAEVFLSTFVAGVGTGATWTVGLPPNSSLDGMRFYNQCFSIDPVSAGGLTVSNAGVGRIGGI